MFNQIRSWREKYQAQLIEKNRLGIDYVQGFSGQIQNLIDMLDFFQESLKDGERFTGQEKHRLVERYCQIIVCVDQIIFDLQILNSEVINYRQAWIQNPAIQNCKAITYLKNFQCSILEPEKPQPSRNALRKLALLNLQTHFVQNFYYFKWDLQEILFYVPESELCRLFNQSWDPISNQSWDSIMQIDKKWIEVNQAVSDLMVLSKMVLSKQTTCLFKF